MTREKNDSHQWMQGVGNGKMLVSLYKLTAIREVSSGDLMHNMVTVTNSNILDTWKKIDLNIFTTKI